MTVNNPQVFTNATFKVGKKISPVHGIRGAFGTRQYRTAFEPTPVAVTPAPTPTAAPVTPAPVTPRTAPTPVTVTPTPTPTVEPVIAVPVTPVPAPTTPKPTAIHTPVTPKNPASLVRAPASSEKYMKKLVTKFNKVMTAKYSPDPIQTAINIEEYIAHNNYIRNYILNTPDIGSNIIRTMVRN